MREFIDTSQAEKERRKLVNDIRKKGITDERVLEAIYNIPRHFFMPDDLQQNGYVDKAFPIGEGQTI